MKKDSFVLHIEDLELMHELDMEQRGELISAIYAYAADEEPPKLSSACAILFAFIRRRMDADHKRYIESLESRKQAAQKAAGARWGSTKTEEKNADAQRKDTDAYKRNADALPTHANACDGNAPNAYINLKCDIEYDPGMDTVLATDVAESAPCPTVSVAPPPPPLPPMPVQTVDKSATKAAKRRELELQFAQFWELYPKKAAKAEALKAWLKLAPDVALQGSILAALQKQVNSEKWKQDLADGGKFIPHAASWLRGRRWEDDIATYTVGTGAFVKTNQMPRAQDVYGEGRFDNLKSLYAAAVAEEEGAPT